MAEEKFENDFSLEVWKYLRVHFLVLHILISLDDPEQFFPPPDGGGESQTRNLDFFPPMQVAEHFVHSLHEDQFPSMVASKIY